MPLLKTEVISKSGFGKSMGEPHSHTTNGVFLDGHVENMRMSPKLPFAAQGTWASAVLFY